MKYNKTHLSLILGMGILTPLHSMAITILGDKDFPSSGVSSELDEINILTTITVPTITTSSATALLASKNNLSINSPNKLIITSYAAKNHDSSYGIRVVNSHLTSNSDLDINIKDGLDNQGRVIFNDKYGAAIHLDNQGHAIFNNKVTINNTSSSLDTFVGIMAYSSNAGSSSAKFEDDVTINALGSRNFGIVVLNDNDTTGKGGELTFNGKVAIHIKETGGVGILAEQMENATPNSGASILFNQGLDVVTENGPTIRASMHGLNLTINGDSRIVSKNTDGGTYNAIHATAGTININGKSTIVGNISGYNTGVINLNLLSGSTVTSTIDNHSIIPRPSDHPVAKIKVNMASGASWNMTGNSYIDTLSGSGTVAYQTSNTPYGLLMVEDLSGSGSFVMRTNLVGDGTGSNQGDLLKIIGTTSGSHTLTVLNNGSAATNGTETLTLVETSDGNGQFAMNSKVELGGYQYDLRKTGNNWELFGAVIETDPGTDPEIGPETGPETDPGTGTTHPEPEITTTADASANFLNVGYLMSYAENQTLLQRMGDLRQNSEHGNMWLRGFAGKFDSFAGGKLSQFDMTYQGMQIGVDKRLAIESPIFVGLFMGQTQGSPNYRSGDGTTKSSNAGLYASYIRHNGAYLNATAKYARLKNSFNVKDSQNERVSGNGSSDGLSLSLEGGHKFNLSETNNGLYIEPQVQFTYGHQAATNITASNGLRVDLGSYESMLGRVSTLFGYELNAGDNQVNVYLKTGLVREFDGNVDYRLNGSQEQHTFKGNWWNNGVGVSAQLSKAHTFYLDVDSATGNKFNQHQVNGGYRFSF
ncbi:P.94 [Pragia fontium]|uniref:autotransporter outer membrane beta-barrel domain-containing protein n=1 Tax=Pragia fontium TaxID=82985 RepID=UPI000DFDF937|nr:autotransporter outer membrane beta-barrel domain-containing protein [Pragia fontium]SUB81465.1 P.94 [Pragia fontium]